MAELIGNRPKRVEILFSDEENCSRQMGGVTRKKPLVARANQNINTALAGYVTSLVSLAVHYVSD